MKNLLEKIPENNILFADFKKLASGIDEISNEEILNVLMSDWDTFNAEELPSAKKKALFPTAVPRSSGTYMRRALWLSSACFIILAAVLFLGNIKKSAVINNLADDFIVVKSEMEGHTNVCLPDGTTVKLNSGSMLKYSMNFGVGDRNVALEGEGFFDVAKNPEKQFVVSAGGVHVAVYGTKFNINAYSFRENVEVSLVEGSVKVATPTENLTITPGDMASYSKSDGRLNVKKIDTRLSTIWMDKDVIFSHDSLQRVFDVLEHRFNVHIKYSGNINLEDKYTGAFGDRRIEDILSILKLHYGFNYSIKDNEVTINK